MCGFVGSGTGQGTIGEAIISMSAPRPVSRSASWISYCLRRPPGRSADASHARFAARSAEALGDATESGMNAKLLMSRLKSVVRLLHNGQQKQSTPNKA